MGAFDPCASFTILMMFASAVSLPTLVARKRKLPVLLSVPPITSSPTNFSTGIDSPVIMDSSTALAPVITSPIHRDLLPWPHDHCVIDQNLFHGKIDLFAVT